MRNRQTDRRRNLLGVPAFVKASQKHEITFISFAQLNNGNWGSYLSFQAISNSSEINDRTYRFNDGREKSCFICNMKVNERF